MREKVVTHQVRIDDRIFRDLAKLSAESGLRSAATLANALIAVGLGDLRSGKLRVLPGGVIERISDQPLPRQSQAKPRQRTVTKARNQPNPRRSAYHGSHGQSSPDHGDRHITVATANPVQTTAPGKSRNPPHHQPTEQRQATVSKPTAQPAPDLTPEELEYLKHPGIVLNPETGRPMVRLDPPVGLDIGLWNARRDYIIRGDEVDEETIPLLEGLVWDTPAE